MAVSILLVFCYVVFRYRERLHKLLEEERGQRRNSWQQGLGTLEIQKQELQAAQQNVTLLLSETDTCIFIHR